MATINDLHIQQTGDYFYYMKGRGSAVRLLVKASKAVVQGHHLMLEK
jgi:hypothetical protein